MNSKVLYICTCLLGALLIATLPVTAAQAELKSPPILKKYVSDVPSYDEYFFTQVTGFMEKLSDQELNVRDDLRFFALLASGYNIQDHNLAQKLINFLFYSVQAGEHYQQYRNNKDRPFTPINAQDEYVLAKEYLALAEKTFNACDICQERYPDFVMYTLPSEENTASDSGYQFTGKLGF
ncbi:MAG: hypothetical protein LBV40_03805 [Methanomicrobiales archaeon]|jgi:hypothetical protein|nr:hypothetical protein [Methanomicrobiales archaeon]